MMNRLVLLCVAATLVSMPCLTSCSDDGPRPTQLPDRHMSAMRFTTSDASASRTVHAGLGSRFIEGEKVGCVIALKDSEGEFRYKANSRWHYHVDGRTGVLVLDHVNGENDVDGEVLLRRHPDYEPETGFLELMDNSAAYAFYFYYPYINNDILIDDLAEAADAWSTDKSREFHMYPGFPQRQLCATNSFRYGFNSWDPFITVTSADRESITKFIYSMSCMGEISDSYRKPSNSWDYPLVLPKYGWENYPAFVNNTQRNARQFGNSDFLWVSYTENADGKGNVTKENENKPVALTFRRMNAVIELQSDVPLPVNSVWFESPEGITRGKSIDLRTGISTAYAASGTPDSNDPDRIQKLSAISTDRFYPKPMDVMEGLPDMEGSYSTYRLILPSQDRFKAYLSFELNGKQRKVDLSTRLTTLERNKLYIIRINKRGECTLKINDWEDGGFEFVEYDD